MTFENEKGGITMTNATVQVLPEVPVTDNEVGVEIIFLEPEEAPVEVVDHLVVASPAWGPPSGTVRMA